MHLSFFQEHLQSIDGLADRMLNLMGLRVEDHSDQVESVLSELHQFGFQFELVSFNVEQFNVARPKPFYYVLDEVVFPFEPMCVIFSSVIEVGVSILNI